MPKTGYRPGAGRPRGTKKTDSKPWKALPEDIRRAARECKVTPLEYMLAVIADSECDETRRDRMAIAAAPYVHPRAGDQPLGKKEQAEQAAKTAGEGSAWGDDLQSNTPLPN